MAGHIKRFPKEFQYDSVDCGSACLAMIASYYGIETSRERISELCKTTLNGVSLLTVREAATQIGLSGTGLSLSLEELMEIKPLPALLHWNGRHFVVLFDIKARLDGKKRFRVMDPAYGEVMFSEEDMREHWLEKGKGDKQTGRLMIFEPAGTGGRDTADFCEKRKRNAYKKGIRLLARYFYAYKAVLAKISVCVLAVSVMQLFLPFLTQAIVDKGIGDSDIHFIYLVLLAEAALIIGSTLGDFIRRWLLLKMSVRINLSLISDFIIKLVKLPMSFFNAKKTGDLLQRIDDHKIVEQFITSNSLTVVFSFFTLVVFSVVLAIYDFRIFCIFFVGSVLYALWLMLFLKKRRLLNYKFFNKRSKNQSSIYQLITGMEEIKLQGCADRKREEWEKIQLDLLDLNMQSLQLGQRSETGTVLINEVKNALITVVSAASVISGDITLGMMLSIQYIIGQLTVPVKQSVGFIFSLQDLRISMERINDVYEREEEVRPGQIVPEELPCGDIVIDNVCFGYDNSNRRKALDGVSCIIPRGKVTAITGCSGSGKTTLIKLLLQYYKPQEGSIKIGGTDLFALNPQWWRDKCSAVMQDGYIFSDTIARNIVPKDVEIDRQRLEYAVRMANAHDTVMALPLKYDTFIGDEGQGLSAGQKQRLLIARAVYKDVPFVFLDEATNSLDAKNEKAITENMQSFYEGKTVIVIAHRMSTVMNADQIIVMDAGKIVETGTHRELVESRSYYYDLIRNQLDLG